MLGLLRSDNQTNPSSNPQGVNQNTRFLAVSAGDSYPVAPSAQTAAWHAGADRTRWTEPNRAAVLKMLNQRYPLSLPSAQDSAHNCGIKIDGASSMLGRLSLMAKPAPPTGFKAQIIPDTFYLYEKSEQAAVTVSIPPIEVFTDRPIIPEGSTASILIKAEAILIPTLVSLRAEPSDRASALLPLSLC